MNDSRGDELGSVRAAVDGASDLPGFNEFVFHDIRRTRFDETYLEFLDEQAALGARGPAWSDRLRRRRVALGRWLNLPLMDVHGRARGKDWWIKIDPVLNQVVYWENDAE